MGPDHVEVMADPPTPIFFFYNAFSAVFWLTTLVMFDLLVSWKKNQFGVSGSLTLVNLFCVSQSVLQKNVQVVFDTLLPILRSKHKFILPQTKSNHLFQFIAFSAKSCISEYWKKGNIEQKGIYWAGLASRCLASRWYSLFVQYSHILNIHLYMIWHLWYIC